MIYIQNKFSHSFNGTPIAKLVKPPKNKPQFNMNPIILLAYDLSYS